MEKVSVITPVYNGGKYLERLLDSILKQTYCNIEVIIVNDGSTDNTAEVIDEYVSKFEKRGYSFISLFQINKGQAAAINQGLKICSGNYLIWPDSDDYFTSKESIEKMVAALSKSSNDISIVKAYANEIDELTGEITNQFIHKEDSSSWFYDCFLEKKFAVVAGASMVKSDILKKELVNNSIYESKGGQNWQLLLPILYNYRGITIPEFLFTVVRREHSHSRENFNQVDVRLSKVKEHEDILKETVSRLKHIDNESKNYVLNQIKLKYLRKRLEIYFQEKMKDSFEEIYKKMRKEMPEALTIKDHLKRIILILNLK